MINIQGKSAFVTGSSRGVGQQIAIGLVPTLLGPDGTNGVTFEVLEFRD